MSHRSLKARWKKRTPPLILSIDAGTSGLTVLAIDALSMQVIEASKAVGYSIYTENDGAIKCRPFDAVTALEQAMADLERKLGKVKRFRGDAPLANVVGVGVVGHMHAGVWMGELGMPVDLASMWNCPSAHDDGLHLTKQLRQRVARRLTLSHVRKELRTRKRWWDENVYSITTPAGFLTWWLTGINAVGPGEYSGMGLVNPETRDFTERLTCLSKEFGVDLTPYAPRCLPPGSGWLRLNLRGLKALRLPAGTNPVVLAGEGDQIGATEFFRLKPGNASGSFGNSGPINCVDETTRQDEHMSTDNFLTGTGRQILNMGLVVVCGQPIEAAAKRYPKRDPFAYINKQAKTVSMDCDGAIRIELTAPEDFLGFTKPYSKHVAMPPKLSVGMDAQLAYLQTAMITRHRLEMMGRGRKNAPKRFVVGGGPTKSDRFLITLATALNLNLELPEGADEATARGLADLIAYEEESAARRERGEKAPKVEAFLDELRETARPCETVKPDAAWVGRLDEYYAKFVDALT